MAIALAQASPTRVLFLGDTSKTITFGSACTNGSRIVVAFTLENFSATVSSVSDGTNTYSLDQETKENGGSSPVSARIYSAANTSTSALTITVTMSAAVYGVLQVYELKDGVGSAAVELDATGGAASAAGSLTINANVTTLTANCAVIAIADEYNNTTNALDSGYTAGITRLAVSNSYHAQEYNLDTGAAGAKTLALGSSSNVQFYAAATAAYKLAGGGGSSSVPPQNTQFGISQAAGRASFY